MNEQLVTALVAFAIIVLGGLGTLVTALIAWLAKKLDTNTSITTQARDASNGRLSDVLSKLDTERTISAGLRAQLRTQADEIAFYLTQHPELAQEFSDRRQPRV